MPHERVAGSDCAHRRRSRRADRYHQLDRMTVQVVAQARHKPEPCDGVGVLRQLIPRAQGRVMEGVVQAGYRQNPSEGNFRARPPAMAAQPGGIQDGRAPAESLERGRTGCCLGLTACAARARYQQYPAARRAQRPPFLQDVGRAGPGDHLIHIPVHATQMHHSEIVMQFHQSRSMPVMANRLSGQSGDKRCKRCISTWPRLGWRECRGSCYGPRVNAQR